MKQGDGQNCEQLNSAGRIEQEIKDMVREMTMMCLSILAMRGILVSERERTELQKKINEHVTQSIEIEAKLVELYERPPAA